MLLQTYRRRRRTKDMVSWDGYLKTYTPPCLISWEYRKPRKREEKRKLDHRSKDSAKTAGSLPTRRKSSSDSKHAKVIQFAETDKVAILNKQDRKESASIALGSCHMRSLACVVDIGACQILVHKDKLKPTLESHIQGRKLPFSTAPETSDLE